MDRRVKAAVNRDKASRLSAAWGVQVAQARYSDDGHWYATLERFPAALFDANGFVLFPTKTDYENSLHLNIGKQISVPKPGISAIPGYVRAADSDVSPVIDVDIHSVEAREGRRLVLHLQRERNRSIVRQKKRSASSLDCEVCGFSFGETYGDAAGDYCEVHHLVPLSDLERITTTRMADLALLCANCHRVVHLSNPPYTLHEVKAMLAR
jgi:5-methylcytosine-specific restriction endonuclease McrA